MRPPVPAAVQLHVWRLPPRRLAAALPRLAQDARSLRRTPGCRFAKLLGTGTGRTFTASDVDPTRWALLTCWVGEVPELAPVRRWDALAISRWSLRLEPQASVGRWSGREPFGTPVPRRRVGPVVALTRARLRPSRAVRFWSAVPPVSAALHDAPGLRTAFGVGEAPLGLQGTFSMWDDEQALKAFAYEGKAHREVMDRTPTEGWYAEELFARFAVLEEKGSPP